LIANLNNNSKNICASLSLQKRRVRNESEQKKFCMYVLVSKNI